MAKSQQTAHTIAAGAISFRVEYRHYGGDHGPSIQVFGESGGRKVQILRFDCFKEAPHYHFDPDGRDVVLFMDPDIDNFAWAIDHIERNLKAMIQLAGYVEIAEKIDADAINVVLAKVRNAIG